MNTVSRLIGCLVVASLAQPGTPAVADQRTAPVETLIIPAAVRAEHQAIHAALHEATRAAGRAGPAATRLAELLEPHFMREEEIALPPLGALAPLAAGQRLPDAVVAAALVMTSALRAELPRMLQEHARIRAAVAELQRAAVADGSETFQRLAHELALHAQTEEEVLYPAAVLVGDLIRLHTHRPQ